MSVFDAIEQDSLPEWPKDVTDDLKDLLTNLLNKDPAQRLTVDGMLAHPWVQQVTNSDRPQFTATDIATLPPYRSTSFEMMQNEQRRSTGGSSRSTSEQQQVGYDLQQDQTQNNTQNNAVPTQSAPVPQPGAYPPPGGYPLQDGVDSYGRPSFGMVDPYGGQSFAEEFDQPLPWYYPLKEPFESPEMNEKWGHVIVRGWLYKRGRLRRSWKRRYFALCMRRSPGGHMVPSLIYFLNDQVGSEDNVLGSIELQHLAKLGVAPKKDKPFRFFVATPERTMYLQALSEESRDIWLQSLRDLR